MLVLTRKCSEIIRIGDDICVKVIRTGRNAVKIGIDAPANVRVLRGELSEHTVIASKGDAIDLADVEEEAEDPAYVGAGSVCSDQFPQPSLV